MVARANLNQNMSALSTSLERLSTGFKINSGKDDPAGLIASEMLRSDITGIKMAIRNTERANMMIATAESALNEVTNLLNDIRGLITEAASTGTMSHEMIYANQLQVDASLDAIDRIASQTTFMGKKLLDGSLDFNLVGIDRNNLQGLSVHQASFGSNREPVEVTINVREAAEKAALYYNQPALAEAIVLQWGGNYGFDMETFDKGATVAEIAEIVNKRSDGTGVVAEVGSDALKGLLYVSSLGPDNDIIIEAGLAGLNEGNVQLKYLPGSSEGVQIKYEEPLYPGAPANILVYLQTEAYQAAFADDVDTTWYMLNGKLVPLRDNNALKFEANIEGAQYNNANIYYVDGSLTDPRFYSSDNPTGTAGMPYTYYSEHGQAASALFGYVPGSDATMGVSNTALAFGNLAANEYFSIQSRATGSDYNDVTIQFVAASPGDASLGGRAASAQYNEQLDAYGNVIPGGKTLTIFYNNNGNTTLRDVQDALNFLNNNTGHGFSVNASIGAKSLTDVTLSATAAGNSVRSNTHQSGGAAGSLFIVLPPDGLMPKTPDIPEKPGVTLRAVGDGMYLAHTDANWDGWTFNFAQSPAIVGTPVDVAYDVANKTVNVVVREHATYDDILSALNGEPPASREASISHYGSFYWSDANGDEVVAGVPRSLATSTMGGVVGRSTTPLTSISGEALYLHHRSTAMDDIQIEFVHTSIPPATTFVNVHSSGSGRITVSYNDHATYDDILNALENWTGLPPGIGRGVDPPEFAWIKADGEVFDGTPLRANTNMHTDDANPVYLQSSPEFNGYTIVFTAGATNSADIDHSAMRIDVTVAAGASYANVLDALNTRFGATVGGARFDPFSFVDYQGPAAIAGTAAFTFPTTAPGNQFVLNTVPATGTSSSASRTLPAINSGTIQARTSVPMGDNVFLAHTNDDWDAITFRFERSDRTGGSVDIEFDDGNRILTIRVDSDTRYEDILAALNDPTGNRGGIDGMDNQPGWAGWRIVNHADTTTPAALNIPTIVDPTSIGANYDPIIGVTPENILEAGGLMFVNSAGDKYIPGRPTVLVSSTTIGSYRPYTHSLDGRSDLIGTIQGPEGPTGLYLQHTDKSWDNLDIKFTTVAAGPSPPSATNPEDHPPIVINFDGKTVNVIINSTAQPPVTYDLILAALNNPRGALYSAYPASSANPLNPTDDSTWLELPQWTRPDGSPIPTSQLPAGDDLRWVDVNGIEATVTKPIDGLASSESAVVGHSGSAVAVEIANLMITHSDPRWDGMVINFDPVASTNPPGDLTISRVGNTLVVQYDDTANLTYNELLDALNGNWSGKPIGLGLLGWNDGTGGPGDVRLPSTAIASAIELGQVTFSVINNPPPTPPLNHSVNTGAVWREITANDITNIFNLDHAMSRGSERAASLFNVTTTIDNDGTGAMRLYNYWIDRQGNFVGYQNHPNLPTGVVNLDYPNMSDKEIYDQYGLTLVHNKTAFENIFGGGVTGGAIVTTAAELITALNNSAFWGGIMCPDMIAELAAENAEGKYYDAGGLPPVITARLAPGNNGYFPVSTFEEVAYYGNPNEGTALQFLGGFNSPNIRFVVDGPNSELYLDRTTVPAVIGQSQAVLTAQDSGASLTITANKQGGEYDDVQFVFKRVGEDAEGVLAPDRRDGWVEYDPGSSFAYAQAVFRDAATNLPVPNSAFYITATERGDLFNDIDVVMRLDDNHTSPDPVTVRFDSATGQLRISIDSLRINELTTNDIIAAINNSSVDFKAELSYAEDPLNDGFGKLDGIGLSANQFRTIANTGNTGGHKGGTVTVWLADSNAGPGAPAGNNQVYSHPTQEDVVRLINNDPVVSRMFTARAYNTVQGSDGKVIDFVKDGPVLTNGGLISPAVITVHLATDKAGNVTTTAADLEAWWNTLDPALVDNVSVSVVRPAGAVWDDCDDPYGTGFLAPTIAYGDCDELIINDIMFVGWNDIAEQQHYVAKHSTGIMTSQRGIDSSYQLFARNLGPEWDGFTIEYINDLSLTGRFADNMVDGSDLNPCDDDVYSGLLRDDCGNLITPDSTVERGLRLVYDEASKKITVHVNFGTTTANDIQQLINSDPRTRNKFQISQLGNGTGLIHPDDDTLVTKGGAAPPGELNGAKLLFGSDATDYYLIFRSMDYGSDQYVEVRALPVEPGAQTTFSVSDANGKAQERSYGQDVDAMINGIRAVGTGLNVSLNTSQLSMTYTFSEHAGTYPGYSTGFTIAGGGATFQVGPDVVSRQQITMGIRSINTVQLGGVSGVLNQIRSGGDANLFDNPGKAFRIVDESLLAITSIRGRLGTMQRATLETNINVLNDTLGALTEAESQIRDTDFAEETSNMTRAQILVQANMNTLGIANQIPNYMLSLLGR